MVLPERRRASASYHRSGGSEGLQEAKSLTAQVKPGQTGGYPPVLVIEDLERQRRPGLEQLAVLDVLLSDDLVAPAVIARELQLVADDPLAHGPDRDRALRIGRRGDRRRVDDPLDARHTVLQVVARRVRVDADL